ncbi:MAG: tRNA (N6-isopentenyl adenosine(37)-C2)-methylthiotransferase MiaB, partial [Lachnospiraceae bacterium]|nr:tRNA (N6-isopentenyl adenosine(37)-C2)-methylthiotransferase MiaB [Lachnospiraceae bacterium]
MYQDIDLDNIDKTAEPPTAEPGRQYYFMVKCRELVKRLEEKNGRLPKCHVVNMGCQMNARDSEKLLGVLLEAGFEEADLEEADFVLYNTCTVRENAADRVFGRLGALKGIKKRNPSMKIALCGCMMQEAHVVEKLKKSYPFVDLIFGTHNLYRFPEYLFTLYDTGETLIEVWQKADNDSEKLPIRRKCPFKSGVNISFGCDNFCSYCIVPYVRGRERSRRPEDIICEIGHLAEDGVKEIML